MFVAGGAAGTAADLYALGATLYHLLTGRLPHGGTQVFQRLVDLQCRPAAWPEDAAADTPEWLRKVILRLLAIEPRERFGSTDALLEQLKSPVEQPAPPRPVFQPETLQPRGIGVLPFENEGQTRDDDWLGHALANYVSRALSKTPGIYVADQDGLVTVLGRLEAEGGRGRAERLLEAGRMVGAGTVITGHYRREGDAVRVVAEALRAGQREPAVVARSEGVLADLAALENALLERLAHALDLDAVLRGRPRITPAAPGPEAREQFILGRQAFRRGDYEQAIKLAEEAVRLDPTFAEAIGFMGVCYARLGRYEAAQARHRQQEELALQWGDARLQIEALANLGVMNYFRGDYEAAEAHYARALRMAEELGLATERAQICNNLGFVLIRRGRPAEAEQAFLRAIETHRAYGGLTSLVGPYNGIGNVQVEQQRYGEARTYYRRALALASEIGDRASVGTTHMHLGRCAALQGRFADAKHEFTMALNALEETRFWNGLARAYEYIGEMNLQLGHYDEAVRCADKRIELARQHSNARMEAAAWTQKAEALKRAGREQEAAACRAHERGAAAPASDPPG
jgi:tetratricopeptide (TPR) repeat protein